MAKDPAVLFYTSDFLTGTMTMTNDQVGKYIRLLCLQHQRGSLTYKEMINICDSYDEEVFRKFTKDGDIYYNDRMKEEADKRKRFVDSRGQNRKKGIDKQKISKIHMINTSKSYEQHMENENENENKDVNNNNKAQKIKKNNYPTLEEVREYFKENGYSNGDKAFQYYDTAGWRDSKGKQVKNWKQKMISVWFKDEYKIKQIETIDKYANTRNDLK